MAAIVRTPVITATDITTSTTLTGILSASCSFGYDIRVATAEIHFATIPGGVNYWDDVSLELGTSRSSHVRFQGFVTGFDLTLYPREVVLRLSGHLILADRLENQQAGGTQVAGTGAGQGQANGTLPYTPGLTDAPASATVNPATLDGIIKQVLNICGITTAMVTDAGSGHSSILGTGKILGTVAVQDYLWSQGESGLSYIQRLDEICLGYRTFDAMGGTIVRQPVSTVIPGSPTIVATFTEGVDIFQGQSPRSVLALRNGVLAQGYTDSTGATATSGRSLANPTYVPTPPGTIWQDLTSRLMECANPTDLPPHDGTVGISCYDAAGWLLLELDQLQVKLDMETFREDLIQPGDIVQIDALSRLDLNSTPMWVQSVTNSVNERGAFTQRLGCLRGA